MAFDVPGGGLGHGEVVNIEMRDVTAPTFSVPNGFFTLLSYPPDAEFVAPSLRGETLEKIVGACRLEIIGGEAVSLQAIAPSQATPGKEVSILLRPEDEFGNLASDVQHEKVTLKEGVHRVSHTPILPHSPASQRDPVRRRDHTPTLCCSNPIRCGDYPPILWGQIHCHTEMSDGTGSLDHAYTYMRDACGVDFGAVTDHDKLDETPDEYWAMTQDAAARFNEPGRFTSFLAYEWARWTGLGHGDRCIYYPTGRGPICRSDAAHYPTTSDLHKALEHETALIIPHHPPEPKSFNDWVAHCPEKERLVEIHSYWGCSERLTPGMQSQSINPVGFVQNALALGWRVGFVAASDDHLGHPGDSIVRPITPWKRPGMTAVFASANTREAIWDALWNRRCYGTTGVRIIIEFTLNGHPMGSELGPASNRELKAVVHGTDIIERVEIVRNNKEVYTREGGLDVEFEWTDSDPLEEVNLPPALHSPKPFTFYYLRVTQADGNMAWSSPIWLSDSSPVREDPSVREGVEPPPAGYHGK